MPQSARHSPLPDLVGSWPISQIGGSPFILPNTVETNATILGTVREPSAGYDVDGASFLLWVDGVMHTVSFAYGAKLPLSEVVSQINSAVGASVASDDNGFLRLKSTTAGEGSSLRLQFNIGSTIADVLYRLGFFPETVAYSGDITQAQHVDPDRQVAQPGQMLLAEGESLTPGIFNRALFQLALNNDRNEGLLSKKQIAVDSKVSTHAYSSPGTPEGYQFSGGTYVFVGDTTTPGVAELEKLAVILDANGREFVKEKTVVDTAGITALASTDSATGWERISATAGTPFTAVHATGNYYIVCSSWTGAAAVLNGVPIKIVKYVNNTQVLVAAVDPATGDKIDLTPTSVTVDLVSVIPYRAKVSGIYDSQGGSRVEGVQISKRSSLVPDRVEKNNRLRITGSFTTAPAVEIGDLVHWSGLNQQPFSNNGTYRVASIPDRHTLELVNEDWTAAFLNPDLTGGAGTFDIESDGKFYKDPFFEFEANGSPEAGDQIQILYKGKSTIREATDDPSAFSKNRLFDQDLDGAVQKAILRIYGPSAETIDDVVYGDVRLNVETLCYRLDAEHEDEDGRHTYISCYDVIPRSPGIWDSGSSTNPWQEVFTDKLTLDAQDNAEGTVGGGWKYKGIGAFHKNTNQTAHDYGHSFVSEITARTGGPYETTAVSVGGQISSAMIANVVAGIWCEADNLGSGTAWLCDAYRGGCYIGASATGTIDDAVVFHAFNGSDGSGTINNYYGVKVDNITVGGTSNYAIYTGTGDVRFGDQTHILYDGSSGPTGWATAPALLVGGTTKTMAVGDDIGASFFEQEIDTVAAGATGWSTAIGARGYATHSANALSWMVGCYGESIHDGTGTIDWADSIACNIPTCSGGGTLTTGVGVGIYPSAGTTGTYVNSYGLFVGYVDEGGTDNYGI